MHLYIKDHSGFTEANTLSAQTGQPDATFARRCTSNLRWFVVRVVNCDAWRLLLLLLLHCWEFTLNFICVRILCAVDARRVQRPGCRIRDRVRIKRLGVWRRQDKSPVFYLAIILWCENKDHARILFKCDAANSGQTIRKIKFVSLQMTSSVLRNTLFQPNSNQNLNLYLFFFWLTTPAFLCFLSEIPLDKDENSHSNLHRYWHVSDDL